jgi:heme-degrading monooxygenase HmoA
MSHVGGEESKVSDRPLAPGARAGLSCGMVIEVAILEAQPGQGDAMEAGLAAARAVISQAAGYRHSLFHRGIENRDRFVLYITWESVADHGERFRKGPLFAQWRSHFGHLMQGTPDVSHFTLFAG